ncbi:MAG: hypothetical protein F6K53_26455 [Moorea sp. SIO4A1]|uniref:hypothetical protein n=2 Tax=unclassified Moorena TaxID=2683338 RepID=UPI00144E937C|nr:hypothetical protein [Moorena sp. SIO4A1]NEQ60769.1 hypothetical protein [Moorena sp. SIO4A1]
MSFGFGAPTPSPLSKTMKQLKHSVINQFEPLDDPRFKREPKHKLVDIVLGGRRNKLKRRLYKRPSP